MNSALLEQYHHNATHAQAQIVHFEKQLNQYSLLRLAVFVLLLLAIYFSVDLNSWPLFISCFVLLLIAFQWLLSRQAGFEAGKNYFTQLQAVNENEITGINGHGNVYYDGSVFYNDKHLYTADLDIFGKNSLFQLANRCATTAGNQWLARWLMALAERPDIIKRQEAVKDIAAQNNWKLELQSLLFFARKQDSQEMHRLFTYLKTPVKLSDEDWLKHYIKFAPFVLLAAGIAAIFYPPARFAVVLIALAHNRLVSSKKEAIQKTDFIAGKLGKALGQYTAVFELIENSTWSSARLNELIRQLKAGQQRSVSYQIRQLSVFINKLNYRLNLVVSTVLNMVALWDVRQVMAIEDWKRSNHTNLENAFDVLAEFEALLSLAGLAINYPEWSFPVIAESDAYTLTAKDIAHPLIPAVQRVKNDYILRNAHHIDLITGSNMAGKSTFLRTLGINTVLALCGAPVCARSMEVSVMQLFTYMRIKDSLNESTSTFKAELDRLQLLLKTVEQPGKVFFLIDEMLRGTNSIDKYLGSKAVIERLIARQGTGLVATHDLQLAELEKDYPHYIRNFYFDIQVINNEMRFDYKLKPGECKTFNASLLLKQIGIEVSSM